MANYVYIATSLDGFIATSDGGLDWLYKVPNIDDSDYGYAEFMSGIDAVVMGRKTFEKVQTFDSWPYSQTVFVLSNSLESVPEALEDSAEVVKGELKKLVADLGARGHSNLYIDGGSTIQSFLRKDLIDELIITRVPVLLGSGIPLFGNLESSLEFDHKRTEILSSALVQSHYVRHKPEQPLLP
ncbi:MAG: dihydrofolate reductase family protein [Phormidesmis sp.]